MNVRDFLLSIDREELYKAADYYFSDYGKPDELIDDLLEEYKHTELSKRVGSINAEIDKNGTVNTKIIYSKNDYEAVDVAKWYYTLSAEVDDELADKIGRAGLAAALLGDMTYYGIDETERDKEIEKAFEEAEEAKTEKRSILSDIGSIDIPIEIQIV